MADYMLMVLEDEAAHAAQPPAQMAELIDHRARFVDELRRSGKLRDTGRFRPSPEGKRVRRDGVEDGPFAGALGSYYWVQAGSVEEAAQLAGGCPALASDEVDVRPLVKCALANDKEARPGKIFGFVVLGVGETEEAWVKVMDRVDGDSSFPAGAFLGGVRLDAPTTGRRVATRGERRATFDGPFLESKEVIGGVFFLRLANLDEAVRWAAASRFVVHGALEVRELWRT
jgi:hypothetical protein